MVDILAVGRVKEKISFQEFKNKYGKTKGIVTIMLGDQFMSVVVYGEDKKVCEMLEKELPKEFEGLSVSVVVSSTYNR